jgi:hypothetical protein
MRLVRYDGGTIIAALPDVKDRHGFSLDSQNRRVCSEMDFRLVFQPQESNTRGYDTP